MRTRTIAPLLLLAAMACSTYRFDVEDAQGTIEQAHINSAGWYYLKGNGKVTAQLVRQDTNAVLAGPWNLDGQWEVAGKITSWKAEKKDPAEARAALRLDPPTEASLASPDVRLVLTPR